MKKTLIMLSGKIGSGKTTVAKYLQDKYEFSQVAFAFGLKQQLYHFLFTYGINVSFTDFYNEEGKNKVLPLKFPGCLPSTIRGALQWYGELMKDQFGLYFWVNQTINKIEKINNNCVIEDTRFLYEIETVKNCDLQFTYNIYTIKINNTNILSYDNHISETHLDNYNNFDFYVDNDGHSKEALFKQIDNILQLIECTNDK